VFRIFEGREGIVCWGMMARSVVTKTAVEACLGYETWWFRKYGHPHFSTDTLVV